VSADAGNTPVTPPTVTSVSPAQISARGGAVMVVQGTQFSSDTTVQLGDTNAPAVEIVSPTELKVTAPPLFAGVTSVKITQAAGTAELPNSVTVSALDLRFVQAPSYSLAIVNDVDAGADASVPADAGVLPSPPVNAAVSNDFDGDGDQDLVTCAEGEPCHFLANDGQGNFDDTATAVGSPRFTAGSTSAHALAMADFDGDGDSDLFLAPLAGAAVVETNDGKASFTETQIGWTQTNDAGAEEETDAGKPIDDPVTAIAAGDLDGDGKVDLVVGNASGSGVPFRILKNASAANGIHFTQAPADAVPNRPWAVSAIAIGDVDKNGEADIVVATPGAADGIELRLLTGDKGIYTEVRGGLPNVPSLAVTALALADVNADGAIDIIAAGQGQDRLLVNDGSGHFFDSSATSMPLDDTTASSIMLVDLDRDRDLDLLIGNQNAVTRLYLNDGKGVFSDHTPLVPLVAQNASWVSAADVDGDSCQDLVLLCAAPTTPRLYLSVEPTP
jgi:FG-GAP-like repeat/IPT/TIG domain